MLVANCLRLYSNPEQEAFLLDQFGAMRWVWNKAQWAKQHAWSIWGCSFSLAHALNMT